MTDPATCYKCDPYNYQQYTLVPGSKQPHYCFTTSYAILFILILGRTPLFTEKKNLSVGHPHILFTVSPEATYVSTLYDVTQQQNCIILHFSECILVNQQCVPVSYHTLFQAISPPRHCHRY